MIGRRQFLAATAGVVAMPAYLRQAWAQSPEVELKLHHLLGPKAPAHTKMLEPWAKAIQEDSAGRVKIEIFPAMSLGGAPPQLFRQVADGVVDIIWTVNGYTPGLFPRSEVFELPTIFTNDIAAANLAMRDMFDDHLAQEFADVHVIFLHVHAGQAIQMAKKLVRTPADTSGLKLRIPGPTGNAVCRGDGRDPGDHAGAGPAAGALHQCRRRRPDPVGDHPAAAALRGRRSTRSKGRTRAASARRPSRSP